MSKKHELEPLIPEDRFGKMVAAISRVPKKGLVAVPKAKIEKPRPKRTGKRRQKKT